MNLIAECGSRSIRYEDGRYWLGRGDPYTNDIPLGDEVQLIHWALDSNRYYEESVDITMLSRMVLEYFGENRVVVAVLEGL